GTASPEVPARPLLEVVAGQRSARDHVWRWRWDLTPRKGCPFTRFRGVRPRPLGDSTAGELTRHSHQTTSRITTCVPRRTFVLRSGTRPRGLRRSLRAP